MIVVAKIGTSSVTDGAGLVDKAAVAKFCAEVGRARRSGHDVVIVTSGAVTAGLATLQPSGGRPTDPTTLRALSAIGQHRLMRVYDDSLGAAGLLGGQVLLSPGDFAERRRYLHARSTLLRLLELGVIPVINENDPVVDDELRFGDNDRLAALVTNLLGADLLVLLTDTEGVFDADPRVVKGASLFEEVTEIDDELMATAGGSGTAGGRGGMASKLSAARIASWSGVRVVIAAAVRPNVLLDAIAGEARVGTVVPALERRLSGRKLWIAFACVPSGRVVIDDGASKAILDNDASLLPAGVVSVEGTFVVDDTIELVTRDGSVIAKGLARLSSHRSRDWVGKRSAELGDDLSHELVHRDDLVVLSGVQAGAPSRAPDAEPSVSPSSRFTQ